jgi:hypothetical protein
MHVSCLHPCMPPARKLRRANELRCLSTYLFTETSIDILLLVIQLVPHVVVAVDTLRHLNVHHGLRLFAGQSLRVGVPGGTAERASHVPLFGVRPQVEALIMDVIAASGLAPGYLLTSGCERHAADGAVVFDRLAAAIVRRLSHNLSRQSGSIVGDFLQFGSEKGVLLAEVLWRFEDVVQNVQHVLAQCLFGIVALEVRVRAAAGRNVRDDDRVYVASRPGDLEPVDGAVFMACVAVRFGSLSARQHVHALGGSAIEQGAVRVGHVGDISANVVSSWTYGLQGGCAYGFSRTSGCPGPRRLILEVLRSTRSSKFSARTAARLKVLSFAPFSFGGTS